MKLDKVLFLESEIFVDGGQLSFAEFETWTTLVVRRLSCCCPLWTNLWLAATTLSFLWETFLLIETFSTVPMKILLNKVNEWIAEIVEIVFCCWRSMAIATSNFWTSLPTSHWQPSDVALRRNFWPFGRDRDPELWRCNLKTKLWMSISKVKLSFHLFLRGLLILFR